MITPVQTAPSGVATILDERRLTSGSVERLPAMLAGDVLLCTCGLLWITQAGDPEDYLLRKGASFIAGRNGLVVVQAIASASSRLSGS